MSDIGLMADTQYDFYSFLHFFSTFRKLFFRKTDEVGYWVNGRYEICFLLFLTFFKSFRKLLIRETDDVGYWVNGRYAI